MRLGVASVARVGLYRAGIGTGLHPVFRISAAAAPGAFFPARSTDLKPAPAPATPAWHRNQWAFGLPLAGSIDDIPDWHRVNRTGCTWPRIDERWDRVPTFAPDTGDIKEVWEASRFDWILSFAQQARAGDGQAVTRINRWMADWIACNPPFRGPNWVCGQEASLRLAHVALAARLLDCEAEPGASLVAFIVTHLRRIAPTVSYALGQDNNHATSEAMGLFVGGAWLARHCTEPVIRREGEKRCRQGRTLLEMSVDRLIFDDGGFSQYSVVYHRLMLDTLCLTELWRRWTGQPRFSPRFYDRARRAAGWLSQLIIPESGDAPNLGANDGAWLLPVGPGGFRDFRPSAALASTLFEGGTRFADADAADALLAWLEVDETSPPPPFADAARLSGSGLLRLTAGRWRLFMRLPGWRFRPSHADALHLDIWRDGRPVAVDSGTYSYAVAAPGEDASYFASSRAHNTIVFDGRDHMPRIGRFLFSNWLRRGAASVHSRGMTAEFTDDRGNHVRRTVTADGDEVEVADCITGAFGEASLFWNLGGGNWSLSENGAVSDGGDTVTVFCDRAMRLAQHRRPRSEFYLHCTNGPALIATVDEACTIRTRFRVRSGSRPDLL